jgi:hypothetical protein
MDSDDARGVGGVTLMRALWAKTVARSCLGPLRVQIASEGAFVHSLEVAHENVFLSCWVERCSAAIWTGNALPHLKCSRERAYCLI